MSWAHKPARIKLYKGANPAAPRAPFARMDSSPMVCEPIDKEGAIQHQGYINLVRAMACAHCGKAPRSQFCHADMDKGLAIKTDCRRGWPGCGPSSGRPGCHHLIGSTGTFKRETRRWLEETYAQRTRAAIVAAGTWPKNLPLWKES